MLQQIGVNTFYSGKGIQPANLMPYVSFPGVYVNNVGLKPIQQPRFFQPVINAALDAGDSQPLNAGDTDQWQILKYLNVWSDTTGELDFYMGPVNYIPVFVTANIQKNVPLPNEGLVSEADNQDFSVLNNSVSTISIIITFSVIEFILSHE